MSTKSSSSPVRKGKARSENKHAAAPRVLSLFAGCGGLDIGFREAGFNILASVELVPTFCESIEKNAEFFGAKHKTVCADISQFSPKAEGIGEVDFVIGGPPCQSFSAAGRRAGGVFGVNDTRGTLFWHYCRILKEVSAKGFLFENVRGILSANRGEAWKAISAAFADAGYTLYSAVLDAAEYGVPQHRERLIMVGVKDGRQIRFPLPTHGPSSRPLLDYINAGQAIADLADEKESYKPYGGKYEPCLLEIPPGSNYLHFTEKMGHQAPMFAWRSRFSDFLYVADPCKPTKTIVASPGKWAGPFHWKKRKFTVPELKRLFAYPDGYILAGRIAEQIKQLGNSVPPRIAEILARAIAQQLFDVEHGVALAPSGFKYHHDTRKAEKATITKKRVVKNAQFTDWQQDELFQLLQNSWKTGLLERRYFYSELRQRHDWKRGVCPSNEVALRAVLSEGRWTCKLKGNSDDGKSVALLVRFKRVIADAFNEILVEGTGISNQSVGWMWDAVDDCVRESSSYDNIQKLYGHFTEPYPQFVASFSFHHHQPITGAMAVAAKICEPKFVERYHPLMLLQSLLPEMQSDDERAQYLRSCGFDLRNHLTNRTIPPGCFRICYPFTTPLNARTFIRWVEGGRHRTADLPEASAV